MARTWSVNNLSLEVILPPKVYYPQSLVLYWGTVLGGSEARICPRCGRPYSYIKRTIVNDRVYLYAVHYKGYERTPNGKIKKKMEFCYLGPEDSYEYVTYMHKKEGLVLKGLTDPDRAINYLNALINYIRSLRSPSLLERIGRLLIEAGESLIEASKEYRRKPNSGKED